MLENRSDYLEEAKRQLARQDVLNREFCTRVLGILTFGAVIFSLAINTAGQGPSAEIQRAIWIMGGSLAGAIILGIVILMPVAWSRPIKIHQLREHLSVDRNEFVLKMGDAYKRSVMRNWRVLDWKGWAMAWLTLVAALELGAFIYFQIHQILETS